MLENFQVQTLKVVVETRLFKLLEINKYISHPRLEVQGVSEMKTQMRPIN